MSASDPHPSLRAAAPADFRALRDAEFPFVRAAPYLNAASVAPLPERARNAIDAYNRRRSDVHALRGDDFEPTLARCRRGAARLVGADADEIALLPNTSFGINLAALSLPLEPGRRVLVSDREFPANVYPWLGMERLRGVRVEVLPTDARGRPDEARMLEEVARGDVGILAVSAVQFTDGFTADLAALGEACRAAGTWFVVDAIQALGAVPVDVRSAKVDILATGGQKWLCSPFGTGFTFVRRELVGRLEPRVVGWTAMRASADLAHVIDYHFDLVDEARRFEVATQPWQDYAGMAESLALLDEADPARVRAHVLALLDPLIDFLDARGIDVLGDRRPERRSGILAFRPADPDAVFRALTQAGIVGALREDAIRLSPHLYNTADDVARVMEVLDGALPR